MGASWVYVSIEQFGGIHWFVAGLIVVVFVMLVALVTGLVGLAMHATTLRPKNRNAPTGRLFCCVQFAVIWVAYEWLRSWLFTGFPVLDAGYVLVGTPFDGLAPILGVKGASLVFAFVAAGIVSGWATVIASVLITSLCVALATIEYTEKGEAIQVGIVQVNIPLAEKWRMAQRGETFRIYSALSHEMPPKDLVVWSEAAFTARREQMIEAFNLVHKTSGHSYLASGYLEFTDDGHYNSLLVGGQDSANYRKHRLVPFGEYIPFEDLIRPVLSFVNVPHSNLVVSASDNRDLSVANLKLAPAICYEASFERDVRKAIRQSDADALVVVSEDAWFGNSLAPHQNFEMARMRAREHGRYVIRAANSGISGIVDPDGQVIARAEQFKRTTLEGEIFTLKGATPYTSYGAVLFDALLVLGLAMVLAVRVGQSRRVMSLKN